MNFFQKLFESNEAKAKREAEEQLLAAADKGDLATVKKILEGDASRANHVDINCTNEEGNTALSQAVWKGHTAVVELLVKLGGGYK